MQSEKLNRTIRFKFGKSLRIGTLVEICQTKENTCLVRIPSEPTLEYLVSKDALTKTDNVQPSTALQVLTILSASYGHLFSQVHTKLVDQTIENLK